MMKRLVRSAKDIFESTSRSRAGFRRELMQSGSHAWLFAPPTILLAAAALFVGIELIRPAEAHASVQAATVPTYTLTPRRIAASLTVLGALIGAVLGGLALVRATRRTGNNGRRGAIVTLVLEPIALLSGALVVATAKGGLGTGNGIGGGYVAIVVGLIGVTLGGLALARSRGNA